MPLYRLHEKSGQGALEEEFGAPDDYTALGRVLDVAAAAPFELSCAGRLVGRRDQRWGAILTE